ncbi:SAM hydrolase/SAM-dependent halogenase family protein [Bavariicoccus seileri]|uniref:SAM hydrolase/SAM-dependent halogenase family protein n=1 Tax=Bavariicoccus seileri TaxID=549685 RepID=UPI0003B70570|nr:S-adenosyl-l-methionine hydroxide adenosyltransferase family protein [Bavariicoccus seileri]
MFLADFLVVQSDFGQADGAVSAMYGVAYQVSEKLTISDLTHDIEPYNIHDASYRLMQTTPYWPKGTVFVSIVDPGVGSNRRSVCVLLETGQYVITPDNGTLTFLKEYVGIKEARQINEATERLPSSGESHTFHGRDIYIYNGARLASQKVSFETLGSELAVDELTTFDLIKPTYSDKKVTGTVDTLDVRFGSLWTNIPLAFFKKWQANYGDSFDVKISYHGTLRYHATVAYGRSFAQVATDEPVLYINSLLNVGLGINLGSFAEVYHIGTGNDWQITLSKLE